MTRGLRPQPLVSVVVAVLDDREAVVGFLDALSRAPGEWEVVVADGGSRDGTAAAARAHPMQPKVGRVSRGRVRQLSAGAQVATGEVLLFAPVGWRAAPQVHARVADAVSDSHIRCGIVDRAAIWIRRADWERSGGFPEPSQGRGSDLLGRVLRVSDRARAVASRCAMRYGWAARGRARTLLRVYANIR